MSKLVEHITSSDIAATGGTSVGDDIAANGDDIQRFTIQSQSSAIPIRALFWRDMHHMPKSCIVLQDNDGSFQLEACQIACCQIKNYHDVVYLSTQRLPLDLQRNCDVWHSITLCTSCQTLVVTERDPDETYDGLYSQQCSQCHASLRPEGMVFEGKSYIKQMCQAYTDIIARRA